MLREEASMRVFKLGVFLCALLLVPLGACRPLEPRGGGYDSQGQGQGGSGGAGVYQGDGTPGDTWMGGHAPGNADTCNSYGECRPPEHGGDCNDNHDDCHPQDDCGECDKCGQPQDDCDEGCKRQSGAYDDHNARHQGDCKDHDNDPDRCSHRCPPKASAVSLSIGTVGASVWSNGTVSLGIPIINNGTGPAANVEVTDLTFDQGFLSAPVLPMALGEVISGSRAVLNAQFVSVRVPGTYLLTVNGTYMQKHHTYCFKLYSTVFVAPSSPTTSVPKSGVTVPIQYTPGVPLPPSPITQENDNNPGGPPIPIGEFGAPFLVPPTTTGATQPSAGSGVTFVRDTASGQPGLFPPDPTAAAGGGVVFASGNTYTLFSKDDGQTFTRIDPTTIFPQSDGGACCDQVITYVQKVDLFFWLIQYKSSAPVPPSTTLPGPNRLRIAWATPQSMINNINAWTYVDLQSSTFSLGNQALDFPDLAYTNSYLYISVDRATTATNVQGLIVSRISFADITAPNATSVGVQYLSPNETTDQNFATGARLTQSSPDAMYWAGHIDTSKMKVFHWADNSNSVDDHDVQVNTWCNTDYTSLAPDGVQWLDNTRTSGTGSVIGATRKYGVLGANGEIWFAWGAGRDSGSCTQGRPQPYVKIARVDETNFKAVGEYHIWNSNYAFAYPALATDPSDEIGVAVSFGGPSNFASTTVGYLFDYVVYYTEASDVTLTFTQTNAAGNTIVDSAGNPVLFTRWGDYFVVRNSGPGNALFSSEGYAVKLNNPSLSKNCTTAPGCGFDMHYLQWGRPPSPPTG